jgi:hypothetical protein
MEAADVVALVLISAIRGFVPLLVLRWPFWGALLCIVADGADTVVLELLPADAIDRQYHPIDKAFDTYYLSIEMWVARRWRDDLARRTASVLFGLRLGAVIVFEITHVRQLLLVGANIFENFYIYVAGRLELDPRYRIKDGRRLTVILLLVAPKILQEYVMHYRESQTWHFVRDHILGWLW